MRDKLVLILIIGIVSGMLPVATLVGAGSADEKGYDHPDLTEAMESKEGEFIENRGQWDEGVLFSAETSFGHIGIGKGCIYYDIREYKRVDEPVHGMDPGTISMRDRSDDPKFQMVAEGHVLKYTFEGANDVIPVGVDEKVTYYNYFIGNDESKWASNVKCYGSVVYEGIYDDIDLRYHFTEKGPKYDLILDPFADPDDIRIKVEGQGSMEVDDGTLEVTYGNERMIQDRDLVTYREKDLSVIGSRFSMIDEDTYGFELKTYDRSERVVIDPLIFSTFIGGSSEDYGNHLVERDDGDLVIAGRSYQSGYPTTPGAYDTTHNGLYDLVVSQLKSDGSDLVFSTFIGGSNGEYIYNMKLNSENDIFLYGMSNSQNFPTTEDAFQTSYAGGNNDVYILKLNNDGASLDYSTYLGGSLVDQGYGGIHLYPNGEVLVLGQTRSSDFPTTSGIISPTLNGGQDIFLTRMSSDGKNLVASTYLGGSLNDNVPASFNGRSFIVLRNGSILFAGTTISNDFPVSSGCFQSSKGGNYDVFVAKIDEDLASIEFASYIGGSENDYLSSYYVDPHENVILSGSTYSSDFPTSSGAYDEVYNGGNSDVYLIELSNDGEHAYFSTYIGGNGVENPSRVLPDESGNHVISGYTASTDFPTSENAFDRSHNGGNNDLFIMKISKDGSELISSTYIGGDGDDWTSTMIQEGEMTYLLGTGNSTDYPTTLDAVNMTHGGDRDCMLTVLSGDYSSLDYSSYIGGVGEEFGYLFKNSIDNLVIFGSTASNDFYTTPGVFDETYNGNEDIFVMEIQGVFGAEPLYIDDLELYYDENYAQPVEGVVDIGEHVFVKLIGGDRDSSMVNMASINVTNSVMESKVRVVLVETGPDTGEFRGSFLAPPGSHYFEKISINPYIDQSFMEEVVIDYPYRPSSISEVRIYSDPLYTEVHDKVDKGQPAFIQVLGEDANPYKTDKAFVNLSSDRNSTFSKMVTLHETEVDSGIFIGLYYVPLNFEFFENITVTSVRDHEYKTTFMIHTPVEIRTDDDIFNAKEDEEYSVTFRNFGYNHATWRVSGYVPWLEWEESELKLTGTPDNNHVQSWEIKLNITDHKGHYDEIEFIIDVENTLPEIITEDVTSVKEGEKYYVDYNSTDDGQGDISWYLDAKASWLKIDKDTGELFGTPSIDDEGHCWVTVQIRDGNGGLNGTLFNLTVINKNVAPRITSTDVKTVTQNELFARQYEMYDPDPDDIHTWSLVTEAPFLEIEEDSGVLSGTPGPLDVGIWDVNVTVTDLEGLSDSSEFQLEVLDVNDQPYWIDIPGDTEVIFGQDFIFDINGSDFDEGGFIVYSVSTKPESDLNIDSDTGMIEWTATMEFFDENEDTLEVTLRISDGELFNLHKFTLKVIPTQAPYATILSPKGGDKVISSNAILRWDCIDPEGDETTFSIFLSKDDVFVENQREECCLITGHKLNYYNVSGIDQGATFYWTVIPEDGCSCGRCTNGIQEFKVNTPPEFGVIGEQVTTAGESYRYKVPGSDHDTEDSSSMLFDIVSGPEGLEIDPEDGIIIWEPENDQKGRKEVTVSLSDGYETAEISFHIEVLEKDEGDSTLFIIIAVAIIILLIIGALLFFLVNKEKKIEEEVDEESEEILHEIEEHQKDMHWERAHYHVENSNGHASIIDEDLDVEEQISDVPLTAREAHAHDHDRHDNLTYDDLYGNKEGAE